MASNWVSALCILACLVLVAVVGYERNRVKARLQSSEASVARLTIEIDAVRGRVEELQSYLSDHGAWQVDAVAPAHLSEPERAWPAPAQHERETTQPAS